MKPNRTETDGPRDWLTALPRDLQSIALVYAHICNELHNDQEILALMDLIGEKKQPIPILFLSTINFLLFEHPEHPLVQFFPAHSSTPRPPTEVYPAFRGFCLEHKETLQRLLPTARFQPNEVTRCANLLPAFELVWEREERKPLALIELGSSAGLLLNWRRYCYTYNQGFHLGDDASPVQIACTLEGERLCVPLEKPSLAQCLGIDSAPLDVNNERDVRWLRACLWPEERERYQRLDAAIALARQYPPRVLKGDACDVLPDLLPTIPQRQAICLFHCFALNMGPVQVKERLIQTLLHVCRERTIYLLSLEPFFSKEERTQLELFAYRKGEMVYYERLAECTFHGDGMEWFAPLSSSPL
jgi:hypothetical protein